MNLSELLTARAKVVVELEATEERAKELKKEVANMDNILYEKFVEEGVSSLKVPGLGSFSTRETEYYSIVGEKKEATIAAFKRDFPDLVYETVNANKLSAFMREAKKEGSELPQDILDGTTSYTKRIISWRRG